jgi:serine phosphatase RsbU (regulator of sigma subunit)
MMKFKKTKYLNLTFFTNVSIRLLFTFVIITLLSSNKLYSQSKDSFFLVDTTLFYQLTDNERKIFAEKLPEYHKLTDDTSKIKFLHNMYEQMNDNDVWVLYLEYIHELLKPLKNKPNLKPFYNQYKWVYHNDYGFYLQYKNQLEKALENYNLALNYAEKSTKNYPITLTNMSNVYFAMNDYEMENKLNHQILDYYIEKKDTLAIATVYNDMATSAHKLGDIEKSLKLHYKALKYRELMGDPTEIATSYNNIASILQKQGEKEEAISYFKKALIIFRNQKKQQKVITLLNNLGLMYVDLGKLNEAKPLFWEGKIISEEIKNFNGLAHSLNNLGIIHYNANNNDSCLYYFKESLKIRIQYNYIGSLSNSYYFVANTYNRLNKVDSALFYGQLAYNYAQKTGYLYDLEKATLTLYNLYKKNNNYNKALQMHEKYIELKDSILSEKNMKSMINLKANYKYEKQKTLDDAENEKRIAIEKAKQKQQLIILIIVIVATSLISMLLLYIYRRLQITKKQKLIIEEQSLLLNEVNNELTQTNEELAAQRDEIERQKYFVEEKNHEITQSIQYAQKIQAAILPSEEMFKNTLPDSFILFKPKDIVSGDFYWLSDREDYVFYATADSTGHGVPGGFMSMLGTALLNEIIDERKIKDCGEVLTLMREKIMQALKQTGDSESKDGMDMVLIRIDKKTLEMEYAAANNSFYLVSNKQLAVGNENCKLKTENCQLLEMPCDKMPVGVYHFEVKPFNTFKHQLHKGDIIYTYTDGYADQFGGEKGKKYTYKRLREKLIAISEKPLTEQKVSLESEFESWKGDNEQIDDVCLLGVRV